ncbi:MAG: transcription elongation factor GreA [Betaproteobacteria bacterium TMED82]|nr:MAG: transcription elongation factor GreA [Betaproteobacteria bacterium TMED82]|tara:strand:+ start:124047 stop:124535 length:489 start_codon:yes stop_codon:yes gene_type:complete
MDAPFNTPLTVVGYENLKKELQNLKSVERPSVIQAIAEARAHGDLSENAEYDAAKERQSLIEGRIKDLEAKVSTAQIINPSELERDGRVVFGVKVKLLDLNDDEEFEYQIVGDDEADLKFKKISVLSPVARALIGKSEGDIAEFTVPRGKREVEILEIIYDI